LNAATLKKRERLDIYADIIEVLKRQPEGVLVTRISYGAGLPLDRIRPMLDALTHCELVAVHVKGDPLQSSFVQRRFYHVTRKGLEFLDAYRRIHILLTNLEKEVSVTKKEKPTVPIDFVGAAE
jgi:predicted transcriptional regulator